MFLQETHFKTGQVQKLTNAYFPMAYHATNNLAKTKGTSILVSRDAPFYNFNIPLDPLVDSSTVKS